MAAKKTKAPAVPVESLPFGDLYEKAVYKDAAALAELRKRLDDRPDLAHLKHRNMALAPMAETFMQNDAATELVLADARRMQQEIAGDNPTPLESLLAERIAVCRATLSMYESDWAARLKNSMTLAHGDYLQRRIDRAHARYLSSIKALAQVRRLQLPTVQVNQAGQVNIGAQQNNVATTNPAAPAPTGNTPAALPAAGCTAGAMDTLDATLPDQDREPATVMGNAAQ